MTLLGAVILDDRVLVAADSQAFNPVRNFTWGVTKLYEFGTGLAWGFAGNDPLGENLARLMVRDPPAETNDWEEMRRNLTYKISTVIRERRGSAEFFGAELKEHDLIEVLVDGYVGGRPGILTIKPRGEVLPFKIAMEVGTDVTYGVEGPIDFWTITPTGIKKTKLPGTPPATRRS